MSEQHTKGPWKIVDMKCKGVTKHLYVESETQFICDFQWDASLVTATTRTDAKLIAAAPELLEALQSVMEMAKNKPTQLAMGIVAGSDRSINQVKKLLERLES